MSATFDTDMFAHYFSLPLRGHLEPATVVNVEGRCYDVAEYYVEDLKSLGEVKTCQTGFMKLKLLVSSYQNEFYHLSSY